MRNDTRVKYEKLLTAAALSYGVASATHMFTVTPERAQTVIEKQKESADFLNRINVVPVSNQSGSAIGIDATGLIARRTDTNSNDRTPRSVHSLVPNNYDCKLVEYDTSVSYEALDSWAHQPGFGDKIRAQTDKQIALNKIMVGFHGTSVASPTDPVANPNGEDVSIGWMKKIQDRVPGQYLMEGATANQLRIGAGGDYENLDQAVADLMLLLDPAHNGATDLIVIIGQQLLAAEKAKFYAAHGNTPTEKSRIEDQQVIGTYGGLPAFKAPYFPARGILITSFSNLSIYVQQDSIRRQYMDNPRRNRIETFQSENIDYVIEDLGKVAAAHSDHILLKQADGTWA